MLSGPVYLSLLIGPGVPVPVPEEVINLLVSVEINSGGETADGVQSPGGFQLVFKVNKRSPLLTTFLLAGGATIPLIRVVIIVTIGGVPQTLMDGMMTDHQVTAGNAGGTTTLTITGEDLTRVMDYIDFSGTPFPGMSVEARVATILAKYSMFGVVPLIVPRILLTVDNPVERIPRQCGTDLQYIQKLAADAGHVFYLIPGPAPGTSTAYWGPRDGFAFGRPIQSALSIDMDAHTNVESLSCSFDSSSATTPLVFVQDPLSKVPFSIPIPSIPSPPLGAIPPPVLKIKPLDDTAKLSIADAALKGLAAVLESGRSVSCSGNLKVQRYGYLLQARRLVGVRGAGLPFDGLYLVDKVTTTCSRGEVNQSFQLRRNELMPITPRVPVWTNVNNSLANIALL